MRSIQASEAKTHLPRLLDEAERGETLVITRHSRPIARLVPENGPRQEQVSRAIQGLAALARQMGKVRLEEILSARDEGRRA